MTGTYTHTCPKGHRWTPGGKLRLSKDVCPACGRHQDDDCLGWPFRDATRERL